MKAVIKNLKYDKIKINWNKNPIPMDLFLSFLTIPTEISRNHLGSSNGWTKRFNTEHSLEISGGIVGGVNYLDSIIYRKNLHNPYNDYVNPFYLFEIMTDEGNRFFIDYYKEEIMLMKARANTSIENHRNMIKKEQSLLEEITKLLTTQD